MTCHVHAFDAREGGSFRISLTYDAPTGTGKTTAHTDTYHGRFVKLVPNEQVVEVVEFETTDPALRGEMTITISLADLLPFDLLVGRIARREAETMAIGMDHHVDIVGVVERRRRALERRVVETPGWRVARPDHPGDAAPIGRQSCAAALCLEIVLVPEAGSIFAGIGVIARAMSWMR